MSWEADAVAAFLAGPAPSSDCTCARHSTHRTRPVAITLDRPAISDWPGVPDGLARTFTFTTFDVDRYRNMHGYCCGDDEVSRSILHHGAWEGFETALVLQLLDGTDGGWFVDVGCQVGWYSVIAATFDRQTLAVDADMEPLSLAAANVAANGGDDRFVPVRAFVGSGTGVIPVGPRIRLAKADIEGSEAHAVRVLGPCLGAGLVDYLMIELSDQFGDGWRGAVEALAGYGYSAFRIPDKADHVDLVAYAKDPLGAVRSFPLGDLSGAAQVNALFVRGDLS